jgi:serine O-acetyltransferase
MFRNIRNDYAFYGRTMLSRPFWTMALYRFGQYADRQRFKPARWLGGKFYGALFKFSLLFTGIFLDRRTRIGKRFFIVHAGMIVIHPEAVFGDDCGIMHGVTVGVNMTGGVPKFGNDVFIGCHATVIGEITIGDGVRIAANSLVVSDVPAGALAMGVPAKIYPNMAKRPDSADLAANRPAAKPSAFRGVPLVQSVQQS